MKNCFIVYDKCDKGHGWLSARNWEKHKCQFCDAEKTKEALAKAEGEIERLKEDVERWSGSAIRLEEKLEKVNLESSGWMMSIGEWKVRAEAAEQSLSAERTRTKELEFKLKEMTDRARYYAARAEKAESAVVRNG